MKAETPKQTGSGKRKPGNSPDNLVQTGGAAKIELTEDELRKVSGGNLNTAHKAQ